MPIGSIQWAAVLWSLSGLWAINGGNYSPITPTKGEGGNGIDAEGHIEWIPVEHMSDDWMDPFNAWLARYKWPL